METCCGYEYGPARELFPPADFQGTSGAHRTRQRCRALPAVGPYLRTNRFQGGGPLRRKDNSARGPRRRLRVRLRCRAKPTSGRRNIDRLPFRQGGARVPPLKRNFPVAQDRLTHVQPLFTWNLSPLRSFKFSLKYLLLPPRSAPGAVRPGLAPQASSRTPAAAYSPGRGFCPGGGVWVGRLSAIHFQGWYIRQVGCYTVLSGFRLPWPPSCCQDVPTPFVVSDERPLRHLNSPFGSSRIASSAYQKWPTSVGTFERPRSAKEQGLLTYLKFENG